MPFKRNGVWYSDIRPRIAGVPTGERIRKRLPNVKYLWEAERAERKMAAELLYDETELTPVPIFEDFVHDTYLPWARENKRSPYHDEFRAEVLCASPQFKGKRMDEISIIQFENFKKERKASRTRHQRPRAPSTINAELNIARSIFRRALVEGVITKNPAQEVKYLDTPPSRARRLARAEERRMFKELRREAGYIEPISTIALNTGMRCGEISRIEVEDINFARDLLFVRDPKWKKDKRQTEGIPINQSVRSLLWRLCQEKKKGRLFQNERGGLLTQPAISSMFRRVCRNAGVKGFRFHDLRHEFGSRLGDSGYGPYDIARLMGHADVKMSLIYVHPQESSLKKAVSAVDSRSFGHNKDTEGGKRATTAAPKRLKQQAL